MSLTPPRVPEAPLSIQLDEFTLALMEFANLLPKEHRDTARSLADHSDWMARQAVAKDTPVKAVYPAPRTGEVIPFELLKMKGKKAHGTH